MCWSPRRATRRWSWSRPPRWRIRSTATGSISLYGIFFDTDKADIKPESEPTLKEIAELLTDDPKLAVIVVGHTDNQGTFDYNLDLSSRRAQAVKAGAGRRITASMAGA